MPKLTDGRYLFQVSINPSEYVILRKAAYDEEVTINQYLKQKALEKACEKRKER